MLKNDIITKLASINVFESMVLIEQAKQENAIGDFESRLVNLEIYRREKLKLKPIRPSWVYKNLHVSVPKANKIINKLIKKNFVRKVNDSTDGRVKRLIATPLLIVRFETYLSTVLLAMDALEILKLERKDKENILNLINSDVDSMPILKGIDPEKLKIITSLWLKP